MISCRYKDAKLWDDTVTVFRYVRTTAPTKLLHELFCAADYSRNTCLTTFGFGRVVALTMGVRSVQQATTTTVRSLVRLLLSPFTLTCGLCWRSDPLRSGKAHNWCVSGATNIVAQLFTPLSMVHPGREVYEALGGSVGQTATWRGYVPERRPMS